VAGQLGLLARDHAERIRRISAMSLGQFQLGSTDPGDDEHDDCDGDDRERSRATAASAPRNKDGHDDEEDHDSCGDDEDGEADREGRDGEGADEHDPDDDDCRNGPVSPPYDAVTLNAYGRGSAAFAGFDLLAVATREGQASASAKTLTDLLALAHPATFALGTSSVVPVELKVTNEGIGVAVEATVTLPAGGVIVDPGPATGVADDRTLTFSFDLPEGQDRTVRLWLRLPAQPGPAVLKSEVVASANGATDSVTATASLTVAPAPELATISAELQRLARVERPKGAIGRAAHHVAEALEARSTARAVREVLKATDDLLGLGDAPVVELWVALDIWLRRAAADAL
jgi:hypothetical protein